MPVFPFVQFEFAHSVGPPPGRYTVRRDDDAAARANLRTPKAVAGEDSDEDLDELSGSVGSADVVVFQVRGALPPKPKRFRGAPAAAPSDATEPTELSVTVATAILATSMLSSDSAAQKRMSILRGSAEIRQETVDAGLKLVRRCVTAYRCASADPYVPDLCLADARITRIGFGQGAEVVRGKWTEAIVAVPPKGPKITRTGRLMPVQAASDILAGSGAVLECEGMLLAVLRELDHERYRAAAVTLGGAVDLLMGELDGRELAGSVSSLADKLEDTQDAVREIAQRGLNGQITTSDQAALRKLAEEAGAVVDAWRYVPLGFG